MGKTVNPSYKLYHPRWYRARMPIFWWLEKLSYTQFITRELTSLAVGYSAVLLVVFVWMLSRGEQAYARFVGFLQSTPALILHTLIFIAVLFHTVTWLKLAPKAMVIRLKHRQVPDRAVLAAHYLGFLAASWLVFWFFLGR
jgi:succinate dehydrogenase subunit C